MPLGSEHLLWRALLLYLNTTCVFIYQYLFNRFGVSRPLQRFGSDWTKTWVWLGKEKEHSHIDFGVFHYVSFVPAGFYTRQPLAGIPHECMVKDVLVLVWNKAGTDTRFAFGGIFDLAQWWHARLPASHIAPVPFSF